jgi:hypothetical protein
MLGLRPDATTGTLELVQPLLPPPLEWVRLRGLRVGAAVADLEFRSRADDGGCEAQWHVRDGDLQVRVSS